MKTKDKIDLLINGNKKIIVEKNRYKENMRFNENEKKKELNIY